MTFRDFLRSITPSFLLNWNRKRKKEKRSTQLSEAKKSGKSIQQSDLENDFRKAGIEAGDIVLVHSSLSRIGHLKEGPKTVVDALLAVVGVEGTILMPTSPNAVYQYDFIRDNVIFDVLNTPSKTGAITEYFRKLPGVVRSIHPTEPVAAFGPLAHYLTSAHFGQLTPYNDKSPFRRVAEKRGKLLYVGVTLSMAGTSLHTLEDAVDFKFPVYHRELFEVDVIDEQGVSHRVKTKVHNPVYSKKRRCDDLIPMFVNAGAMRHVKIGEAESLIADAKAFFDVMLKNYQERGVTMYTPFGSSKS
jgi:aminoglycoside 3-N-acetyltransferase